MMNNEKALDTIGDLLEFAVKFAEQNDNTDDANEVLDTNRAWDAIEAARFFLAQPETPATPSAETPAMQEETPLTKEQLLATLEANNLTLSDCMRAFAADDDDPYAVACRDMMEDGNLEMDNNVITSEGNDGAYVLVWKFVSKEDAGIEDEEGKDGESAEDDDSSS